MERPDVDEIICATDAGREGECVFRYVYCQAGCTKPFKRLWISSMTDEAIRDGFEHLRPGSDYDALYRSGLARNKADWIVGMNATQLFTVKYRSLLSVGRVQTPTLAMLVEREKKIQQFASARYFTLELNCGKFRAESGKIEPLQAEQAAAKCGKTAVVKSEGAEERQPAEALRPDDSPARREQALRLHRAADSGLRPEAVRIQADNLPAHRQLLHHR